MEPTLQPEHAALEQDIERLAAEVGHLPERTPEATKEAVREILKQRLQAAPLPAAAEPPGGAQNQAGVLPSYMQSAPPGEKLIVERLIDLAWHKGIAAAVQEARSRHPLIMDAFHDALTNKVFDELMRRKRVTGNK